MEDVVGFVSMNVFQILNFHNIFSKELKI